MGRSNDGTMSVLSGQDEPAPRADARQKYPGQDSMRAVASVIADELSGYYLDVHSPGWHGSHYLEVTNLPGMLCGISVRADGSVEWEHRPCEGRHADPACTAETVLAILGADTSEHPATAPDGCRCGISFKGTVGRMLADHGLRVTVGSYPDQFFFEVYSHIDITNPACPERGAVRITDDGVMTWRCRARAQPTLIPCVSTDEVPGHGQASGLAGDASALDPAQIARIIAQALTERHQLGKRLEFAR